MKSIEFRIYANNKYFYKLFSYILEKHENDFEKDNHKVLKKMVNLYEKVNNTCFHDLANSIELWIGRYGDKIILEDIQNKKNSEIKILEDIIKNKLK